MDTQAQPGRARGALWAMPLWLVVVAVGYGVLLEYDNEAGDSASAATAWPDVAGLEGPDGVPVLVMAVHPRCPCTRASIAELARLMARTSGRLTAVALVFSPDAASPEWAATDLREGLERIPDVRIVDDPRGDSAAAFGMTTSGQVVVYDGGGALAFTGGITASRGHEGDNFGREQILSFLDRAEHHPRGPVYGCALFDPTSGGDVP